MNREHPTHHEHRKRDRHAQSREQIKKEDEVTLSSDDSFPASDPPSWIGVTSGESRSKKEKH